MLQLFIYSDSVATQKRNLSFHIREPVLDEEQKSVSGCLSQLSSSPRPLHPLVVYLTEISFYCQTRLGRSERWGALLNIYQGDTNILFRDQLIWEGTVLLSHSLISAIALYLQLIIKLSGFPTEEIFQITLKYRLKLEFSKYFILSTKLVRSPSSLLIEGNLKRKKCPKVTFYCSLVCALNFYWPT